MRKYIEAQLKTCPVCKYKGPIRDFIYGNRKQRLCTRCSKRKAKADYQKHKASGASYYQSIDQEEYANKQRAYVQRLRTEILEHYGAECSICKDYSLPLLEIHQRYPLKDSKGKRIFGKALYLKIIQHNFPSTIQILCRECRRSLLLPFGVD